MTRMGRDWMVGTATWVVFVGMICQSTLGREVKLTIYPQKVSTEGGKYSLLPPQASLTDGDGVPLYNKAAPMAPDEEFDKQVR